MNLSQRLLQTLDLSYVLHKCAIRGVNTDCKNYKKKIYIYKNGDHHRDHHMVQQSTHRYLALGACIHLLTFLELSTLLLSVGVNSLAIVVSPPPTHQLCKTGGSWECYLLHGFTTLFTSPSVMLQK